MKHKQIHNFIYPDIKPHHRKFGADNAGEVIRENGDWRDYLPPEEEQNKNGVESSACYIEAQQHTIATILEEEFGLPDQNFSSRFNVLLSGGTEYGGDPLAGADSIVNDGLIAESFMPFSDDISSWSEFASWKGATERVCRAAGQLFKKRWNMKPFIVFEINEPFYIKYDKLKSALKRSPVPMSVYPDENWLSKDPTIIHTKPDGARDVHLVECVYVDEFNRPHIRDTYPPFNKILAPYYNSDFAMRWSVKKLAEAVAMSFCGMIKDLIKRIFNRDYRMFGADRSSRWSHVRNEHIKKFPECAVCGKTENLTVHHKKPFHVFPELELEPTNLVTLCESAGMHCHITFGHLGSFKSYNGSIEDDIKNWNLKVKNRP
jgi:5-methylcytosine-specific restriction enzyme A